MRGLSSILSLFRNELNKFNNVTCRFYLSYDINIISISYLSRKNVRVLSYA